MFDDSGKLGFDSLCEVFQLDLLSADSVAAFDRPDFADDIILGADDIHELVIR